jgi:hypothetical protein
MVGARYDTTPTSPDGVLSELAQATAAGGRPVDVPSKVHLTGAVVLQDGAPAKGARVFFSTVDHAFDQGEVRAETTADDSGAFHRDIPPVDVPWAGLVGAGTLWAHRPGSLVAFNSVYRGALPPGLPQRLVLGPPTRARFEVFGPDGTAIAGATIEPRTLARDLAQVPDRLALLIGAETVTDTRGRAAMTAFFPDELTGVRVTAKGYG